MTGPDLTPEREHWLLFNGNLRGRVSGCHCGFRSHNPDDEHGDEVVAHLLAEGDRRGAARVAAAVEAVLPSIDLCEGRAGVAGAVRAALAQAATLTEEPPESEVAPGLPSMVRYADGCLDAHAPDRNMVCVLNARGRG